MTPIQQMFLGVGGATKTYIDDVFSAYVYAGNSSTQSIDNGIDLSGEGGMTWIKGRDDTVSHFLYDTVRGAGEQINTDSTTDKHTDTNRFSSFNSNGFTLGNNSYTNDSSYTYSSWSFRKAKGFFDVVTFTQDSGTPTNQRISHGLGSAPGMIWMKCTSDVRDWFCYHRSLGKDKYFKLNDTGAAANATNGWGTSEPDATEFGFNAYEFGVSTGSTYVAYLFAHDNQSYGEEADQSIIKCGTFNKASSGTDVEVDVGWEPQFVFTTMYEGPSSRGLVDQMRGLFSNENARFLKADTNNQENNTTTKLLSATGFKQGGDQGNWIYMAIRFPDGYVAKPLEAGTEVFAMDNGSASTTIPTFDSGFAVDMSLIRNRYDGSTANWELGQRIMDSKFVYANLTNGEATSGKYHWDSNEGVHTGVSGEYDSSSLAWMWKRGKGMDSVYYTGNGNNTDGANAHAHSLGQAPEMIWIKTLGDGGYSGVTHWTCSHKALNGGTNPWQYTVQLNQNNAEAATSNFGNTAPTSTNFYVGEPGNARSNDNGARYLAVLFASVEGISKVGSYTGDGTEDGSKTVTFGFQPRVVLIKKYNSTGNWMLFDSLRGNTKYLYVDSSDAQQTAASPARLSFTATGITLTSAAVGNTDGDSYLYYAHA